MQEQKTINYLLNQNLSELSLFINNICNLRCKHCYVGTKNEESDLSLDNWKSIINEAVSLGINIFGIVGKEPLLTPDKTFDLIDYIKQNYPKTIVGFVTNGTLLDKHIKTIIKANLDYIDISIDGTEEGHDYIRGEGSFQRTLSGIRELIKVGFPKEKLFLSITTTNKTNLIEIIKFFDKEGILNFVISPYLLFSHNASDLVSNHQEYFKKFFQEVKNLKTKNKISLIVKTDYNELELIKFFIDNKYIDLENLQEDKERKIIFTEHNINNLSIYFNFLPFNTELVREIRITSDGYVLSCIDQGHEDYKKRSIGNVKENNLKSILNNKKSREIIKEKLEKNIEGIKRVFS